ncbi:nucleotide disphospho-sugar-binding domain-containing protein [Acetivibrio cellulolyticus]|uniref:nucleotide disphospho-sugar-binding domain-containing protein n=1 Tax=Acetivibrio cellulolyticus TaxID=35830 RepID=UPI0001E2E733|nr:nucleotide disphospho-sugar-binding domain-containing protein [Acetivibrio cellulolyticus]
MKRILMVNVPYAGHTNPTLLLASELVKRGYSVTYVNAEEFRTKIEKTGALFIPYINYPDKPSESQKKTMCFRAAYDTVLALKEKYDLLIYEMFFYPGYALAQKLGIPCIRQFSQPAWNKKFIQNAPLMFRISAEIIDSKVMKKKHKKHMGLEDTKLMKAILEDRPNLNIVYVPSVFQNYRESFDESYHFAVPPVETTEVSVNIPYEKMKPPIIYISLGSIISNKGFCKGCIRAFGNTEFSVILNTGKVAPDKLGKIPDNIYAYSFVPQIDVLNHADVFLTHCGMNSVNEAIAAKVPMIVMPFVNDQLANAKRIVEMGIGKRIRSFPSSSKQMYRVAQAIIADDSMYKKYATVAEQMGNDDFLSVVDEIEKLLM